MNIIYPPYVDPQFQTLFERIHSPRVCIDNDTCRDCTLVKVDSANKHGLLLEMVQVLTDLDLVISKSYVSSDGGWLMDVFHVTDQLGRKLTDEGLIRFIQQAVEARREEDAKEVRTCLGRIVGAKLPAQYTVFEMTGTDRPGLLSEISAVLKDMNCNVVSAHLWTHNARMACIAFVTDCTTSKPITDLERLDLLRDQLCNVLRINNGCRDERRAVRAMVLSRLTHAERRLHQMMFEDKDYEGVGGADDRKKQDGVGTTVSIDHCQERSYSVVTVLSRDRPKLLFDTVVTLTDMKYVVFHAAISSKGSLAIQEYFVRHMDGCTLNTESEKRRVVKCLEAAIERRNTQGLRLDVRTYDRIGLLTDITRVFRENGLMVTRAEVSTSGDSVSDTFFVTDSSGNDIDYETIDRIRQEIGNVEVITSCNLVKRSNSTANGNGQERPSFFSIGNLLWSQLERFSGNFGSIKS
ncbi:ACT domain-containing protein ACR3-like isoform X2 [Nymphaea colorata]|nr:ACT domain-containing protein ACR3-like isoform X2 [Nymphaea colorata]